jgi:hypothetical protein
MLFDWLITGQGVSMNPAAAVRGPKHMVNEGKMPVLGGAEWGAADRQHPDRARIATFTYSFARIDAALKCASKPGAKGFQLADSTA